MKTKKKIHRGSSRAVPGTVKVTKKGDHCEIVVVGCNVSLSDEKLGIALEVKQP